jgi:hypothetical protein
MRRSSELLKGLCLLALPIAALHVQSIKTSPEVGQQVHVFRDGPERSDSGSQIDHGTQRRHAGLFPFCGLVTVL